MRAAHLAPLSAPPASTPDGATPSGQALSLEFVLPPSHQTELRALLAAQQDPSSPQYHQWLTPAQYAVRFGPDPATVGALQQWLAAQGLTASRASTFAVRVRALATAVESGLHVTMRDFLTRDGRRVYAAQQAPLLPDALAGAVTTVLGLDDSSHLTSSLDAEPSAHLAPRAGAVPSHADGLTACSPANNAAAADSAETPDQVGAAYQVGSVTGAGQTGRGQTVGVFEVARMSASDVSAYEQCFGLSNTVSATSVDGGGPVDVGGTQEADADVEQIATQAPGATIVSYQGPNSSQGDFDTWSAIVSADVASVVSTSWGDCESLEETGGSTPADDPLFQEAAAQGQTVVAASGDSGSEDCYINNLTDTSLQVDFPASDAWVTGVGGTEFTSGTQQTAWNYCAGFTSAACAEANTGFGAGGGGISQYTPRPSWQPADWEWTSPAPGCGTNCRDVPDVSANAGTFEVFYTGGTWGAFAGTSLASPLVAGLVADVDTGCAATRKGELAPLLYGLASQQEYGIALTDVTTGDNDLTDTYGGAYFPAASGYDPVTGVGTPLAPGWSCPEVTSASPSAASAGSEVTVGGFDLQKASFSFGGSPATVISAGATERGAGRAVGIGNGDGAGRQLVGHGHRRGGLHLSGPAAAPPGPRCQPHSPDTTWWAATVGCSSSPKARAVASTARSPASASTWATSWAWSRPPTTAATSSWAPTAACSPSATPPSRDRSPGSACTSMTSGASCPPRTTAATSSWAPTAGCSPSATRPSWGRCPAAATTSTTSSPSRRRPGTSATGCSRPTAPCTPSAAGSFGSSTDTTSPATAMAATPNGGGYWIVTRNGNVFAFGEATWRGSLPFIGVAPSSPVIGIVPTADDLGYWLIGSDGGIFAFGDAPFVGSLPGLGVDVGDIVGAVPTTL